MIGYLKGIVQSIRTDHVLLNVGNVGYRVFASASTLQKLHGVTQAVELFIETHVREDHIHLYGFMSEAEQEMFLTLTTVQGVGAKMGLAILSSFEPVDIANVILAQDKTSLTRVSGVGKRIAERIVTELKTKLPSLDSMIAPALPSASGSKEAAPSPASSHVSDALSALENLGYARVDAHQSVQEVLQEGGASLDELITGALKRLAR